jgi:hypothetical protein
MPAEIAALNDAEKRTEGPESTRGKLAPAQANAVNRKHKINRPGWTCHRGGMPIIGQSSGSLLLGIATSASLPSSLSHTHSRANCHNKDTPWWGGGLRAPCQKDRCNWPRVYAASASCFHSSRCAGPQQRLLQTFVCRPACSQSSPLVQRRWFGLRV